MRFENHLYPVTPEQIEGMRQPGPPGPIVMINLLKIRARAQYADGRETNLSGREAYALYGNVVVGLVRQRGGRLLFAGEVTFLPIGLAEPLWDQVALMEFPNRQALAEMAASKEWQDIAVHRTAGLEGQLDIETTWHPGLRHG